MSVKDREVFLAWHKGKIESGAILTDFNYATLTSPYIFQKTVDCKLPLLR